MTTDADRKWVEVPVNLVCMEWTCPSCDATDEVSPGWIEQNGTLTCAECDEDMELVRVLVARKCLPSLIEAAINADEEGQ